MFLDKKIVRLTGKKKEEKEWAAWGDGLENAGPYGDFYFHPFSPAELASTAPPAHASTKALAREAVLHVLRAATSRLWLRPKRVSRCR